MQHWRSVAPGAPPETPAKPVPCDHPLLALLHAAPHTSEGLSVSSGWPLPKVLAGLTELELDGRISCEAGRWFARAP
ncbi:Rossmann fold nucleotide-binding protein Smf involved in DNA uptake [Pseudomonas amygdali pv. myricae]|nr:Rossmann fold nucleotide-binding protein Smf involved in DNA uptake [Pseudomonas amygdali pv. myricae]